MQHTVLSFMHKQVLSPLTSTYSSMTPPNSRGRPIAGALPNALRRLDFEGRCKNLLKKTIQSQTGKQYSKNNKS